MYQRAIHHKKHSSVELDICGALCWEPLTLTVSSDNSTVAHWALTK